jgi:hypothetical protein
MLTMVPEDEAQRVKEWKLPIARTGLGNRSVSLKTACSSSTLSGRTTFCGTVMTPPS